MLVFSLLVLLLVEASGLPMGQHPVSLNRKAVEHFDQIIDKLNSLNLRKARDVQQETELNLQGAVKQFVDRAQSVMDAVTLNRRVVSKSKMSKNENHPENVIASVFDNLVFNKKDLQNAMLMKKDELNRQLGLDANKMARDLKNDLMLKRDLGHQQHLKEIEKLASNLLDLKSLHERTLIPNLKGKMKKNVEIRNSIDRLSESFDIFPWKQEKLQNSERDVNQREQSKDVDVSRSADVVWFPWKQVKLQNSARDVNQREQSKDVDVSRSADAVFPWKQVKLQNPARDVNQREQSKDVDVSRNADNFFPWKQVKLQNSARDVNQREQSKDVDVSRNADIFFPWKQVMLQNSARDVNQREQSNDVDVSRSADFVIFPWKQVKLQNSAGDVNQREQSKDVDVSRSADVVWFPWKQVKLQNSARDVNQREQSKDVDVSRSADIFFPWKQVMLQNSARDVNQRDQSLLGSSVDKSSHSNAMRDLGSQFTWDWKKDFYQPLLPENNKREQDSFLDF